MYLQYLLLIFPFIVIVTGNPLPSGCNDEKCDELVDGIKNTTSVARAKHKLTSKVMDEWFGDIYPDRDDDEDGDRTWRLNRKALVPILIGLGLKTLGLIAISLTVLSVIGSLALASGKISLTITALMILKRFFSSDMNSGGFFGLNPLRYPQPSPYSHGDSALSKYPENFHAHQRQDLRAK